MRRKESIPKNYRRLIYQKTYSIVYEVVRIPIMFNKNSRTHYAILHALTSHADQKSTDSETSANFLRANLITYDLIAKGNAQDSAKSGNYRQTHTISY